MRLRSSSGPRRSFEKRSGYRSDTTSPAYFNCARLSPWRASGQRWQSSPGPRKGSGFADAQRLAAGGYAVVVADLDGDAAAEAAETLGGGAIGLPVDVVDPAAVDELFARVDRDLGRLDVLVNNAGISYPSRPSTDRGAVAADARHPPRRHLPLLERAYPLLARQGGAIVNVSSIAAILGAGKRASYSAAKGGIAALTRDLAIEWAPDGIRVNAVAPGVIETEILTRTSSAACSTRRRSTPASRSAGWAVPRRSPRPVYFLAETATYVTGQVIVVDGGFTVAFAW